MLGWLIMFAVAAVVGFRRGIIDGKAVVAIAATSLFFVMLIVAGRAAFTPLAMQPGALGIAIAFLGYFLPLLVGFLTGAMAKKRRIANGGDGHG